jgi:hypothetical protein
MAPPCRSSGRLPAHLCGAEHDRLIAGGVLGGDTAQLLECASDEEALFTLPWVLLAATGQWAWVALVSLATNLRLAALPCCRLSGAWDEKLVGLDGANHIADGTTSTLG